jgi:hypothetical protein
MISLIFSYRERDKIRLLGFTTLHDSRRYAIPPYLILSRDLLFFYHPPLAWLVLSWTLSSARYRAAPSLTLLRQMAVWAGFTSTISHRSPRRLRIPVAPSPHPSPSACAPVCLGARGIRVSLSPVVDLPDKSPFSLPYINRSPLTRSQDGEAEGS